MNHGSSFRWLLVTGYLLLVGTEADPSLVFFFLPYLAHYLTGGKELFCFSFVSRYSNPEPEL
jgi:hypothetical protein